MKKSTAMSSMLVIFFAIVLMLSSTPVSADKVVVIPLFSAKKLGNVVAVTKSGGDFTDPVAAVNSITNASSQNRYLVFIGPGVYTLDSTLVMKDYISVTGSGIGVTILRGNISSGSADASSAIVAVANRGVLSDLSISNNGGGYYSFALYSNSNSNWSRVNNVRCYAQNGSNNRGIFLDSKGSGYATSFTNVKSYARASGTAYAYGIYISGAPCEIYNSFFNAFGGNSSRGIYLTDASNTKLINVEASAHDSSISNHGMMCNGSSYPTVRQSYFEGWTYGISIISGTVRVLNSSIEGGVNNIGGTLSCVNSNNGTATELTSNCQTP